MIKSVGNGIVVKDGRWVILCGSTEQPVRLLDAQNREIEPKETAVSPQDQPEKKTAE